MAETILSCGPIAAVISVACISKPGVQWGETVWPRVITWRRTCGPPARLFLTLLSSSAFYFSPGSKFCFAKPKTRQETEDKHYKEK